MIGEPKRDSSTIYMIKIKGRLENHWTDWFEGLVFTYENDGTTTIQGPLPDQAALHSILLKIRDMNLTLISVTEVGPDAAGDA